MCGAVGEADLLELNTVLDSIEAGLDAFEEAAPEAWSGDFWTGARRARFSFAASVAYLF